ncbi:unnamed protein product [Thlaspi arvense]|uniref:Pentatricopeptide repeat-containing protein n=1 Tax=Thlaspi arvense TaxID=13288 RepID=A0AAU9RTF1_THLAR|nr:unnamed protein product [Thlaspi arvense]
MFFSGTPHDYLSSECFKKTQFQFHSAISTSFNLSPFNTTRNVVRSLRCPGPTIFPLYISSLTFKNPSFSRIGADKYQESSVDDNSETSEVEHDDDDDLDKPYCVKDETLSEDVIAILGILQEPRRSISQVKNKLQDCSINASSQLVVEVLSRVRHDWEAAFTFFIWAAKQPGYAYSLREYHSMISILAKMRKFDTAWALINEMRHSRTGQSLVTPKTLLIMIRRYCAAHEVGKAINTFYAHKLFEFDVGMEEFHILLSALCRYKNVRDAEHLLFCNENVFPFNTKSFNIILNGWCNIIGCPREAKRIWREMYERGIAYDVISYSSIISCFSKTRNLKEVLKLFNQMKHHDIAPDRKVYNAVIHALAKGRRVKEARFLLQKMEEDGISPNSVTYNSLIKPLCRAHQLDDAQEVFHEMLQRGLSPTVWTYHAFFRILRSGEQVFTLLEKMNMMGCLPSAETYTMLIRKFCRWHQHDDALRLWNELSRTGVMGPDDSRLGSVVRQLSSPEGSIRKEIASNSWKPEWCSEGQPFLYGSNSFST